MALDFSKLMQDVGYIPPLPAVDLKPQYPQSPEDNLPQKPFGLPEGWDYRNAERGPDGQNLPNGAVGWTPQGEAYYGGNSATANWWNKFTSGISRPVEDAPDSHELAANAVQALLGEDEYEGQPLLGRLGASLSLGFQTFGQIIKDVGAGISGDKPGEDPSILTTITRAVPDIAQGVITGLNESAEELEQIRGGIRGVAELSGFKNGGITGFFADQNWGWWEWGHVLLESIDITSVAHELLYAGASLVTGKEVVDKAFSEGYEAGRILGTQFSDPAVHAEYIRRLRAGENPYLLAEELQNPIMELAFELFADPLNFIGGIGKLARVSGWAGDAAQLFTKIDDADIARVFSTADKVADSAEASVRASDLVQANALWQQKLRAGLGKIDEGLRALTPQSKRIQTAQRAGSLAMNIIVKNGNKPAKIEDTINVFRGLAMRASDDLVEATKGLDILKDSGLSTDVLFSRVSGELGVMLKEMGALDSTKFLDEFRKAETVGDLFQTFGSRVDNAVDRLVPNLKDATNLSVKGRAILLAEKVIGSKPYTLSRNFFGSLYMGYNPGYLIRNMETNFLHLFVDEGIGTFLEKGRFISPTKARDGLMRIYQRVPEQARRGLGAAGMKLSGPTAQLSSKAEVNASMQIFYKITKDTLRKSYNVIHKASEAAFKEAGATDDFMRLLRRSMDEFHDADKVADALRQASTRGYVDGFDSFHWLDDTRYGLLEDYGKLDDYKAALSAAKEGGEEAVLAAHRQFFEDIEAYARESAKVPSGLPANLLDDASAQAGMAVQSGYVADNTLNLGNVQRIANKGTEEAFTDVFADLQATAQRLRVDVSQLWAKNPPLKDVFNGTMLQDVALQHHKTFEGKFALYRELLNEGRNADVAKYWTQFGLQGTPPANLTKNTMVQYFWEGVYFPQTRRYFRRSRDAFAANAQLLIDEARKIDPRLVNENYSQIATNKLDEARLWDNAQISNEGLGIVGSQADSIRKLAILNGIPTVTEEGAKIPRLLRTINKYLPEGVEKFTDEALVPFDVAKQALQKWAQEKGNEFVDLLDEVPVMKRGAVDELIPPLARGSDATISPARAVAEQLHGFRQLRKDLEAAIPNALNTQIPVPQSQVLDDAITAWQETNKNKFFEAKLMAEQVAGAGRDFALLPYETGRRNFDTILAMLYPYHFWHSRTYVNWVRRVASNPGVVAGYGKYRDTLAEVHAGAPEWWKYNVNSDELLGLFPENPLFFNLEANFNPMNGLIGVDFNDPYKRINWWTNLVDDLGKFGPTPWTFIPLGVAMALQGQVETEAAARWAGRLIPQTATIEAAQNLLERAFGQGSFSFLDPLTKDPAISLFAGGVDPRTRDRTGRALAAMVNEGLITQDQAIDAAATNSGEVWDAAWERAVNERAWGQISSNFLGAGFRPRSISDLQADQFYADYFRLFNLRDTMSPAEFRADMDGLKEKYPFMDTLLISRKQGDERDTALAYNVLGRIPPGNSELAQTIGLDQRLLSQFYDTKGRWDNWSETDKDRFMASITDLRAILATPDDATREEWTQVRNMRSQMEDAMKQNFGADVLEQINSYYAKFATNPNAQPNPTVSAALDFKAQTIATTPLLTTYYGGVDAIEKYYESLMWNDIEAKLGEDFWQRKDAGQASSSDMKKYYSILDNWNSVIDQKIITMSSYLPEGRGIELREVENPTVFQEDLIESLAPPQINAFEVMSEIGETSYEIVQDFLATGDPLPYTIRRQLVELADSLGVSYAQLLTMLQQEQMVLQ